MAKSENTRSDALTPTPLKAVLLACSIALAGCDTVDDRGKALLRLDDLVDHQAANVSTDFISASESIGLEQIDYGLRLHESDDSPATAFSIPYRVGRLLAFSADGDLAVLEIEAGLPKTDTDKSLKLSVKLNNKRLKRLTLTPGIEAYRIDVADGLAVGGQNRLEIFVRASRSQRESNSIPTALIGRIRLRSATGRRFWPSRPNRIRVIREDETSTASTVQMPTASFLDMVFEVPPNSWLRGSFSSSAAPNEEHQPIEIYTRLMDDQKTEQSLVSEKRQAGQKQSRSFDLDLSSWVGKIVRLRFGVSGRGNAIVSWKDVGIFSSEPDAAIELDPVIELESPPQTGRLGSPNIVVIMLDAARADAFSPFGAEHPTPALEKLAADGTKFMQAISTSPWTGQSVPSVLTGLFADTIGIGPWGSQLPESVPTLAELLSSAGYRTVLWSQHPFYRNRRSLKRGFQEFRQAPRGSYDSVPDPSLLFSDAQPTFAWVHFIPPHAPYRPPAPFRGSYSSWYTGGISAAAPFLNRFPKKVDPKTLNADDLQYLRDRYLENAAFADDLVRRVVKAYEDSDRYDDSLIVVLSDHGEAFLEHSRFLHTRNVHTELLHVPFVVKWPKSLGPVRSSVEEIVPLIDLLPTLVDGITPGGSNAAFQGRSLLPVVLDDQTRSGPRYAITRGVADRTQTPQPEAMYQYADWRVIYDPLHDRAKVFRPLQDPKEQSDLSDRYPMRTLLLRQAILRQMATNKNLLGISAPEDSDEELDPEVIEQLQALGYLN